MILDPGGGIFLHMFAGFFGLACSMVYSPRDVCKNNPNRRPSYGSIVLVFLGTFF